MDDFLKRLRREFVSNSWQLRKKAADKLEELEKRLDEAQELLGYVSKLIYSTVCAEEYIDNYFAKKELREDKE